MSEEDDDEKKEKEKKDRSLILCVGSDRGYWANLKERFINRYMSHQFVFEQFDIEEGTATYPEIFLGIVDIQPKIIFVDFTTWREQKIRLSQLLTRDYATKKIPLLGLVRTKDEIPMCWASGAKIVHVKSGEYHDVVYTAAYLLASGVRLPTRLPRRASRTGRKT